MKKTFKIVLVIFFLLLENIAILFVGDSYRQYKQYEAHLDARQGLGDACEGVAMSESLFSVLEQLNTFQSWASVFSGRIYLDYGTDRAYGPGIALVFDKNHQLTHKSCKAGWEPEPPGGSLLDALPQVQ